MGLESLLKPVKAVDEEVLRYYSKLTRNWEKKGRSRYSLAHIFNLSSIIANIPGFTFKCTPSINEGSKFYASGYGLLQGMDLASNMSKDYGREISMDGVIAESEHHPYRTLTDVSRFPLLLYGLGFMGKGVFDAVDYLKTNNASSLSSAIGNFSYGYSHASLASSMYVKESNPKLLDKAPAWKKALNWAKEKYSRVKEKIPSFTPPLPEPIPVQNYKSIDNYVKNQLSM